MILGFRRGFLAREGHPMRAGLYARVSTYDQQTLALHAEAMTAYIRNRGWVATRRIEDVVSGAKERPGRESSLIYDRIASTWRQSRGVPSCKERTDSDTCHTRAERGRLGLLIPGSKGASHAKHVGIACRSGRQCDGVRAGAALVSTLGIRDHATSRIQDGPPRSTGRPAGVEADGRAEAADRGNEDSPLGEGAGGDSRHHRPGENAGDSRGRLQGANARHPGEPGAGAARSAGSDPAPI